jgi:hypothetical protein
MLKGMTQMKIEDQAAHRLKSEARRHLPFLIEFGNEEDIVAFAKKHNPKITEQQIQRVIKLFLDAKRERANSPRPH